MITQDFDLEQFARLLDTAIHSDVPAVKKALSNFLLIAALCQHDNDDEKIVPSTGPFETMVKKQESLERRVANLEYNKHQYVHPNIYGGSGVTTGGAVGTGFHPGTWTSNNTNQPTTLTNAAINSSYKVSLSNDDWEKLYSHSIFKTNTAI